MRACDKGACQHSNRQQRRMSYPFTEHIRQSLMKPRVDTPLLLVLRCWGCVTRRRWPVWALRPRRPRPRARCWFSLTSRPPLAGREPRRELLPRLATCRISVGLVRIRVLSSAPWAGQGWPGWRKYASRPGPGRASISAALPLTRPVSSSCFAPARDATTGSAMRATARNKIVSDPMSYSNKSDCVPRVTRVLWRYRGYPLSESRAWRGASASAARKPQITDNTILFRNPRLAMFKWGEKKESYRSHWGRERGVVYRGRAARAHNQHCFAR